MITEEQLKAEIKRRETEIEKLLAEVEESVNKGWYPIAISTLETIRLLDMPLKVLRSCLE